MRPAILFLTFVLGACGESIRDDHFANDIESEGPAPEEITITEAVPIRIGELGPSFNACAAVGTTRRVAAGGKLPVRAAPFETGAQTGFIAPGHRFFVCSRTLDQKWFGIVFDADGRLSEACNVSSPVTSRQPYQGPCSSGWIQSPFVKFIAGDDVPAPAVPTVKMDPGSL